MDPFALQDHTMGWPRRLLNTTTMTSMELDEQHRCGLDHEPKYNILSYTWGRWEREQGHVLPVRFQGDISWKIPAVDPDHFSVDDFMQVVKRISRGLAYVWIDVACIDQENRAMKMSEVGRQATIFNRATTVFVWLTSFSVHELQECLDEILQCSEVLYEEDLNRTASMDDEEEDAEESSYCQVLPCLQSDAWVSSVVRILERFLVEPWFSSLWTLQEMFLRGDAEMLSREAETAVKPDGSNYALGNFIINCSTLYEEIVRLTELDDETRQKADPRVLTQIKPMIERLGFGASIYENPALLYSAARHRNAMDPLDKIYGIMQVFGFRLGETVDPGQKYTLPQLEDQYGAALNSRSAVRAQLFVHTRLVEPGSCWRVDQFSDVPREMIFAEEHAKSECRIALDEHSMPFFDGRLCAFADMAHVWRKTSAMLDNDSRLKMAALDQIFLDASQYDSKAMPMMAKNTRFKDHRQHELAQALLDTFGDHLYMLYIGKLVEAGNSDEDLAIGVIAMHEESDTRIVWRRIGVCLWSIPSSDVAEDGEVVWQDRRVRLG